MCGWCVCLVVGDRPLPGVACVWCGRMPTGRGHPPFDRYRHRTIGFTQWSGCRFFREGGLGGPCEEGVGVVPPGAPVVWISPGGRGYGGKVGLGGNYVDGRVSFGVSRCVKSSDSQTLCLKSFPLRPTP